MASLRSDPEKTAERAAALAAFLGQHVLHEGVFRCRHHAACRASRPDILFCEGHLHHLGRHDDREVEGRPLRIVALGQDHGHGEARVDLRRRSEMIAWCGSRPFSDRGRNPHRRGTASTIRLLPGHQAGSDRAGEMPGVAPGAHRRWLRVAELSIVQRDRA